MCSRVGLPARRVQGSARAPECSRIYCIFAKITYLPCVERAREAVVGGAICDAHAHRARLHVDVKDAYVW